MKLLRLPEVSERVRRGKSTIYAMIQNDKFPAPIKQGRDNYWIDAEIDQYLERLALDRKPTALAPQPP